MATVAPPPWPRLLLRNRPRPLARTTPVRAAAAEIMVPVSAAVVETLQWLQRSAG